MRNKNLLFLKKKQQKNCCAPGAWARRWRGPELTNVFWALIYLRGTILALRLYRFVIATRQKSAF